MGDGGGGARTIGTNRGTCSAATPGGRACAELMVASDCAGGGGAGRGSASGIEIADEIEDCECAFGGVGIDTDVEEEV